MATWSGGPVPAKNNTRPNPSTPIAWTGGGRGNGCCLKVLAKHPRRRIARPLARRLAWRYVSTLGHPAPVFAAG